MIHVDALTAMDTRLLDLEVGVSNAAVNSEGLVRTLNEYSRPIIPEAVAGKNSYGHSSIAEVGVGIEPDGDNQIAPFEASSASPGGEDVDESLISQTIDPLLHVDILRNVATSRWNADTCVIGEPIATGEQHLARAQILEQDGDDDADRFDGALVGIDADTVGPERAATHVISLEQLFAGSGDGLGLQSVSTATIAPVTLFGGTPNETTIELSGPAFLSVVADGTSGGANVLFRVPVVTIIQAGEITEVLPGEEIDLEVPGGGDNLASIKVGVLHVDETSANGRSAKGIANVVEIELLDIVSQDLRGTTIAIGHMEAESNVPAGGIECPIPVSKSANPRSVSVEDLFTVTITIDNPFECPLTGVALVDDISTRTDARFEVVRTRPGARAAPSGRNLSSGTVRWDIGTIQPGESATVRVTMLAQGGAGRILDTATATGSLSNCPAGLGEDSADITSLANVRVPVSGRAVLEVPESRVLAGEFLPTTGLPVAGLAGLGLLGASGLGAAALALQARRRKARFARG